MPRLAPARWAPAIILLAACAPPSRHTARMPAPVAALPADSAPAPAQPLDSATARAVERRLAELRTRGGDCARYGAVLERSLREGRIAVRPFMWRVGGRLASGEARPNGDMLLARDVDPLNPGVRTLDDLLRTMEHEAAHIAFDLREGTEGVDRANGYVARCRS